MGTRWEEISVCLFKYICGRAGRPNDTLLSDVINSFVQLHHIGSSVPCEYQPNSRFDNIFTNSNNAMRRRKEGILQSDFHYLRTQMVVTKIYQMLTSGRKRWKLSLGDILHSKINTILMRYFSWPLVQSVSLSRYAGDHATFCPARGGVLRDDRGLVVWTAGFIPVSNSDFVLYFNCLSTHKSHRDKGNNYSWFWWK